MHRLISFLVTFSLLQVQGKDPSVDITQDIVEESEDEKYDEISDFNTSTVDLPSPEIGRLEEINEVFTLRHLNFSVNTLFFTPSLGLLVVFFLHKISYLE